MGSKILVVDDSQVIRASMREILEELGYVVLEGRDGAEGLEVAIKNPDIAFIFADYNMPNLNGVEMLTKVKQEESLADVPCIILTSMTTRNRALIAEAKKAGVIAWVNKPFAADVIKQLLDKLLVPP